MPTALLLVDIQNDYFPGGALPLVEMEAAAANAARLLEHFRAHDRTIVHIQHLSVRAGATFFLPNTRGAEHHATVAPRTGETVLQKNFPNAFRATALQEILAGAGIRSVVIAGAMSHMCIDATTRAAWDLGYECSVAHDACATRDLVFDERRIEAAKVHGAFMAALGSPYARVAPTRAILTE
jgi:nicotinamidase-related amidase